MKKVLPIIGIVLIALIVGYLILTKTNVEDYSYVILKINPEVELGVDSNEIVREVNPLNEDGEILLSDMNLLGKPLEEVTENIIDSTEEMGKLENLVELTVMNISEEKRLELETKLKTKIEAHIKEQNYNALLTVKGVTEEIKTSADTYEISYGKMLLISKAIELNPELKVEDLAEKTIKEIQSYIKEVREEKRTELLDENKKSLEQLNEEYKQKKEELKTQIKTDKNSNKEEENQDEKQEENTNSNSTETQDRNQTGR